MSTPCLHCEIWRTIRDHVRAKNSVLEGRAICDRHETLHAVGSVLAETIFSEPDLKLRAGPVEQICAELWAVAEMPGSAQPRTDLEVVSWQ